MTGEAVFSFKKRIESIQVLRFCLAVLVFLSHFESLTALNIGFASPVFIFYMISAFVAMLSTADAEKRKGFLRRRIVRLLPLYWAVTLFTFAAAHVYPSIMSYTPDVWQLLKSLFCIPFSREAAATGRDIMRPILGPAHTLEVEVFFSLIFFICMRISHKKRGFIAAGCCIAFFAAGEVFEALHFHTPSAFVEFYVTHNRYSWIYFFLGIVLYMLLERAATRPVALSRMKKFNVIAAVWTAAGVAGMIFVKNRFYVDVYYIVQAFAAFGLLYILIMLSQYGVKAPRALVFCGNISFSFYLVHYYPVHLAEKFFGATEPGLTALAAVLAAFAVAFGVACVSYLIFEKKIPEILLSPRKKRAG